MLNAKTCVMYDAFIKVATSADSTLAVGNLYIR